jgi:hypothetical protein
MFSSSKIWSAYNQCCYGNVDCSTYCGNEWFFPANINLSGSTASYCSGDVIPDISGLIDIASCGTGTTNYANWNIVIYQDNDADFGNGGATAVATCGDPNSSCSYTPNNATCGTFYYYAIVTWDAFTFDPSCSGIGGGSYTSSAISITVNCDPSCSSTTPTIEPGIIVNEFSNGDSGSREYMEFLVIGDPCTTVDLRGWIFDDNNGLDDATCEGFSTQSTDVGVAPGHYRFRYIDRWSAVPVGSLILVYNSGDKNLAITLADDPTDSNNDLVYVLPMTDSGLESNGTLPNSTEPNCLYSPATYTTPPTSWAAISLNNTNDACQTRRPDGSYFHGFSYGSTTKMTGGPDDLNFNETGTGKVFYLNCGHHSFITDYSVGSADFPNGTSVETPGAPNNSLNQELVNFYRGVGGCGVVPPCVVLLSTNEILLKGKVKNNENLLNWFADELENVARLVLQKSTDNALFSDVTTINAPNAQRFAYSDFDPFTKTYYRVGCFLNNGTTVYSNTIVLTNKSKANGFSVSNIAPNPANTQFSFNFNLVERGASVMFKMYNVLGELVMYKELFSSQVITLQTEQLESGMYYLVFSSDNEQQSHKLLIQH